MRGGMGSAGSGRKRKADAERKRIAMTITEKVAHLKGFIEGIELDESTKEGKVIKAMVDILDDMALSISDIEDEIVDMSEQVEDIDQDLEMVIEDIYGDE